MGLVTEPDLRVEVGVGDVHDQVHQHVDDRDDQGEALDHGVVAARMASNRVLPTPDRSKMVSVSTAPAEQGAQLQADDGDHRQHGVAEGVAHDHARLGEALGAGGADVVEAQDVEQARSG